MKIFRKKCGHKQNGDACEPLQMKLPCSTALAGPTGFGLAPQERVFALELPEAAKTKGVGAFTVFCLS